MPDSLVKELKNMGLAPHKSIIGKRMGNNIWFHSSYSDLFNTYLNHAVNIKSKIDFEHNIIRIDIKNNIISLINSPDFDTSFEPYILESALFEDGKLKKITTAGENPQIYHHKWMFVDESYQGFNYREQLKRSLLWKRKLGTNKKISSRIGRKDFWNNWLRENNLSI